MNLIECTICYDSQAELIKLPCKHTFCISCPTIECPDCLKPFTIEELQAFLPNLVFEQYCQKRLNSNSIKGRQNERMIDCFECKNKYFVWEHADYYNCPVCVKQYCLRCRQVFHPQISCMESSKFQDTADRQFIIAFRELGFQQCPVCCSVIERTKNCNFIRCSSAQCKKSTCFCYTCGEQIMQDQHWSHYENNNPYVGKCLKIKTKKQAEPNLRACPGCNSLDPEKCELIDNFGKNICFCRSIKCAGKYYCMGCGSKVILSEMECHFDDKLKCEQRKCSLQ